MRCKPFTFKKTTKRVNVFRGLSVDLTVADAKSILNVMKTWTYEDEPDNPVHNRVICSDEKAIGDLYLELEKFVAANE